jgi:hypothetical protein
MGGICYKPETEIFLDAISISINVSKKRSDDMSKEQWGHGYHAGIIDGQDETFSWPKKQETTEQDFYICGALLRLLIERIDGEHRADDYCFAILSAVERLMRHNIHWKKQEEENKN